MTVHRLKVVTEREYSKHEILISEYDGEGNGVCVEGFEHVLY